MYAISVALIGPLMRVFTLKVRAQRLLPVLMAIFIISNIIGMLASNFPILLLSRLLSASMRLSLAYVECGGSCCASW